jgi:hypothetical protein
MPDDTLYTQTLQIAVTRTGLVYTCVVTGMDDADDSGDGVINLTWTVEAAAPSRGLAIRKALNLAVHRIRFELPTT